jgi:hypothetical protein
VFVNFKRFIWGFFSLSLFHTGIFEEIVEHINDAGSLSSNNIMSA